MILFPNEIRLIEIKISNTIQNSIFHYDYEVRNLQLTGGKEANFARHN